MNARPALCYLCGQPLSEPTSSDHAPMQQVYAPEIRKTHSPNLLTIPVHGGPNIAYKTINARPETVDKAALVSEGVQETAPINDPGASITLPFDPQSCLNENADRALCAFLEQSLRHARNECSALRQVKPCEATVKFVSKLVCLW